MLTRRSLLAVAPSLLVPLAGCQTGTPETGVRLYEIQIRNDDTQHHSLTIRVEADGEVRFQRDYELPAQTTEGIPFPETEPDSYVVFAAHDGGDYRLDTTASIDSDTTCVVVVWEISRSGSLAGYENEYTNCSDRSG